MRGATRFILLPAPKQAGARDYRQITTLLSVGLDGRSLGSWGDHTTAQNHAQKHSLGMVLPMEENLLFFHHPVSTGLHLRSTGSIGPDSRSLGSWGGGPHDGPKPCTEALPRHGFANGRKSALFSPPRFAALDLPHRMGACHVISG